MTASDTPEAPDPRSVLERARSTGDDRLESRALAELVPEITGLTLGETFGAEFRELFEISLELCR